MIIAWLRPDWPVAAHVRALSTYRTGGVSEGRYASLNLGGHVGDAPQAVAENRARLKRAAALPGEPAWLTQVHGTRVCDLDAPADAQPADAAVTRRPGTVCALLTADCLPVLLANEAGTHLAAAHAGWRGLAAGILEATVAALGVGPDSLLAWFGPAIGPQHFEVGVEVRAAFLDRDGGAGAAFRENARGRFMADLYELARRRLAAVGVRRVFGGEGCTFSQAERYYSHRRDGTTGRQATLLWRER